MRTLNLQMDDWKWNKHDYLKKSLSLSWDGYLDFLYDKAVGRKSQETHDLEEK
jgi:hypothetical protein